MLKPLKWDGTGPDAVDDLQQLADAFVAAVYQCGDFPPNNGEGKWASKKGSGVKIGAVYRSQLEFVAALSAVDPDLTAISQLGSQ
eukprot:gene7816-8013_t